MAAVHREFLQIRGATDVITFPTGEILVCPDVAIERAGEFGNEPTVELALYAIHGFLHLAGLDDLTPRDAGLMARVQERILKSSL
jgi:probable rRNA maturation factor